MKKNIPPKDFWEKGALLICSECGEKTEQIIHSVEGFEQRAWKCPKCGDITIHPIDAQQYLRYKKLSKEETVKVGKLADSLIIRVPKQIAEVLGLQKGKKVKLKLEKPKELRVALE